MSCVDTKISVIMPARNREQFIEKAIECAINQTFRDWELIVVDDDSEDRTAEIVERISRRDSRVRLIRSAKCANIAEVQNVGLERARGEFIAIMDSDDWCDRRRFETELSLLCSDTRLGAVSCWALLLDEEGKVIRPIRSAIDWNEIETELPFQDVLCNGAALLRRSALDEIGGFDQSYPYSFDSKLWIDLVKQGYLLANVGEELYRYRIHTGGYCFDKREEQNRWAHRAYASYFEITDAETYKKRCIEWLREKIGWLGGPMWIWGSGKGAELTIELLSDFAPNVEIVGQIDHPDYAEGRVKEYRSVLENFRKGTRIGVSSYIYRYEIAAKLKKLGLEKGRDFFFLGLFADHYSRLRRNPEYFEF